MLLDVDAPLADAAEAAVEPPKLCPATGDVCNSADYCYSGLEGVSPCAGDDAAIDMEPEPELEPIKPAAPVVHVRLADYEDVPALVALGQEFFASGDYWAADDGKRWDFHPVGFAHHLLALINRDDVGFFVGVTDDDEIASAFVIILTPDVFAPAKLVAMKLHWLTAPRFAGYGRGVLKAAKNWAKARGATRIGIGAISDRSQHLLETLGFHRTEVFFSKDL